MTREKHIIRASVVGILANITLVIFKLFVGLVTNSIAITVDAINNLTDVASSVITIVGTKLAARRPDEGHPYGHGRFEYLTALMVGVIILVTGVAALAEAIPHIIHPEIADYSWISILIIAVAVIVKLALGIYVRQVGRQYNSSSLAASGVDALFDAVLSFSTLVGIIVTMLFRISIDGILGAFIALLILRTSLAILLEAIRDLLGQPPSRELLLEIKHFIAANAAVRGVYDLHLHNYGPDEYIGSVHIQISERLTAKEIFRLTREISECVFVKYGVVLTIGIFPENRPTKSHLALRQSLDDVIKRHPSIHQIHGFYIDEEQKLVSFDLVIDFSCRDQKRLRASITRALQRTNPDYKYLITFDFDTSDNVDAASEP